MMTGEELKLSLKALGYRQADIAWMMGVNQRQARRWIEGKHPVPRPVKLLLLAIAQERIGPAWLRKHIDEEIPYNSHNYD